MKYLSDWESKCYKSGIPEEIPTRLEQLNKAPSYKQIVKAIMKNDVSLKGLGLNQEKSIEYHNLKYIELTARQKIKQLRLPL